MYTVGEFISLLLNDQNYEEYDWVEEQDIINRDKKLDRKNAARIVHEYILHVRKEKDFKDITKAYEIKDLFDCRVCANHIAQVYLRGLMEPERIGNILLFNGNTIVTEEEAFMIKVRIGLPEEL